MASLLVTPNNIKQNKMANKNTHTKKHFHEIVCLFLLRCYKREAQWISNGLTRQVFWAKQNTMKWNVRHLTRVFRFVRFNRQRGKSSYLPLYWRAPWEGETGEEAALPLTLSALRASPVSLVSLPSIPFWKKDLLAWSRSFGVLLCHPHPLY